MRHLLVAIGLFTGLLSNWNGAATVHAQSWQDYGAAIPKIGYPSTSGSYASPLGGPIGSSVPGVAPTIYGVSPYGQNTRLVPSKNWKLGVYVQNTNYGAVVQNVEVGSAGQLAGIEPGDVIVAVGPSRIGEFDNRTVDIAEEIRRNADAFGRVSLVIQNVRTKQLGAMNVSLNSTSSTLSGSVATRDQSQLPFGSVLTVELRNLSKPYYEIAGGKAMTRAEGYGPYAFELNYDPRYIDPNDQYQLNAYITVNNQVVYSLPQPIRIAPSGFGQPFNIVVDRGGYPGFGNSGAVVTTPIGTSFPPNVVTAGYPGSPYSNQLMQLFQTLLGRPPSSKEIIAWQAYLDQGNSINDVSAKLLSSPQYRDRFGGSEAAYIQSVLTSLKGRGPTQDEINYWLGRLQATGSPERVISELMLSNR